jgi:hypothetical protein
MRKLSALREMQSVLLHKPLEFGAWRLFARHSSVYHITILEMFVQNKLSNGASAHKPPTPLSDDNGIVYMDGPFHMFMIYLLLSIVERLHDNFSTQALTLETSHISHLVANAFFYTSRQQILRVAAKRPMLQILTDTERQ